MTNLDGLQNITSIGGFLSIQDNSALDEFCGLNTLLTSPSNGVTSTTITGNLSNPTTADIIDGGACARILPIPAEDLPLMPGGQLLLLAMLILGIGAFSYRKLF